MLAIALSNVQILSQYAVFGYHMRGSKHTFKVLCNNPLCVVERNGPGYDGTHTESNKPQISPHFQRLGTKVLGHLRSIFNVEDSFLVVIVAHGLAGPRARATRPSTRRRKDSLCHRDSVSDGDSSDFVHGNGRGHEGRRYRRRRGRRVDGW